jgi:hypothetical protein
MLERIPEEISEMVAAPRVWGAYAPQILAFGIRSKISFPTSR